MATLEAFYAIRAPLITISKIIGAEIWTSDKLFQPASYVVMAHMVVFNVCHFYTVLKYSSDMIKVMQVVIIFGIATQLIFKFFLLAVAKKNQAKNVFSFIEEHIYRQYTNGSQEEKQIIEKMLRFLRIGFKLMFMLYFSTFLVFGLWPVYVYYSTGQLVPLFSYEIPKLNVDEFFGYGLTLMLHTSCYLLGIAGILLADFAFIIIAFHILASSDLFVLHLKQMEWILKANDLEKQLETSAEKWKRCILDHQVTTQLLEETEDFFNIACLVHIFTCVLTICDAMVLVVLTDWYAALCFLVVVFGEITIYFILGNIVELKIDEMYNSITELPWNLMTLTQQKEYCYLLARSQRPMMITIYGFAPMNFESYMTVLKMLYQFFVVIMQYVE